MATRAAPTGQLLHEYGNYTILTGAVCLSGSMLYASLNGDWPTLSDVATVGSVALLAPATLMGIRSFLRLMRMGPAPVSNKPAVIYSGDSREIPVNGGAATVLSSVARWLIKPAQPSRTFSSSARVAFDPTIRDDPDIKSRVIKYRNNVASWAVRLPTGTIIYLSETVVYDIADKAWRQQEMRRPHPLSASKLMSLRYHSLGGRRLYPDEYVAFVTLGERYGFIGGRRQGSSGRLLEPPVWCVRRLRGWA